MARRFWKDRAVERPRTFTIQNNPDGSVTLIPAPGAIVEPGTPVNAANLNGLEEDLETHMDDNVLHEIASFSTYSSGIQLQPNIAKDIIIPLGKAPLRSVKFWGGLMDPNSNIQIIMDLTSKDAYYVFNNFNTASYFKLDTAISLVFYSSGMKLIKISVVNSNLILTLEDTETQWIDFKAFTEAI